MPSVPQFQSIEICAGAGGQALGLEKAGFGHAAVVEIEEIACETLRLNRPKWNVVNADVRNFSAKPYQGADLLAGGVPCPPFSKAGKQLGAEDERDLFPEALRLISESSPRAVLLENVRGLLDPKFDTYREQIIRELSELGYESDWRLVTAADFGVPQLRPRSILVAFKHGGMDHFSWPTPTRRRHVTVGDALHDLMAREGWEGADAWREGAQAIGPTLVGGSKKHGGPDLGPTRAKKAWAELGVCGLGVANEPPQPGFEGMPKLTVRMTARIQGFPDAWQIAGRKTAAYRQVGNAFPPPVAQAVGKAIRSALEASVTQDTALNTLPLAA
jgi:DNA (cytosine-5)-methyltransferase 1